MNAHNIRIRIDGANDLRRAVRDIQGSREQIGKGSRLLIADTFIAAMIDAGLLPEATTYVRITAEVGSPIRLDYETFAYEEILAVPSVFEATDDPSEAGTP